MTIAVDSQPAIRVAASFSHMDSKQKIAGLVFAGGLLFGLVYLFVIHPAVRGTVSASPERSAEMCLTMAAEFQRASTNWSITSWAAGIISALLSAIGGSVGSGVPDEKRWYRRSLGVILATVGSSLAATAAYSVARSNAASSAAASATVALAQTDPAQRYTQCIDAKAQWLQSRADSLD